MDTAWTNVGSKIPTWEQVDIPVENMVKFNACKSALDYYKLFSTDNWVNYVVEQSRLYAVQKGLELWLLVLTADNFRSLEVFYFILVIMR